MVVVYPYFTRNILNRCIHTAIHLLRNADKSSNRKYMCPTVGSQGHTRSKRFTITAKTHSTCKEIDELELINLPCEDKHVPRRNTQHRDPMMITKIIAWKVDNSHEKDSDSTNGE